MMYNLQLLTLSKMMDTIEFFYIKFFCNPKSALIPRFDTETLVREAIKVIKELNIQTLIDIGTGTGIIPISIEKNTTSLNNIYGFDLSKKALKLAKKNKELNNSRLELIESDLLNEVLNGNIVIEEDIVLITANLPYIKDDDWENIGEDVKEEPRMALFGGKKTGFELYENFFTQVLELKRKYNNIKIILICEFGYDQSNLAEDFFKKLDIKSKLFSDLCGVVRFIYIEI